MDERESTQGPWRRFEFAAITTAAVTFLFVLIGHMAEQLASNVAGDANQIVASKPQFNAIDYSSTGSAGKSPVIIGPCATRQP